MTRLIAILIATLCGVTCGASLSANNNLFLPGDAFFPVTLTDAELKKLEALPEEKRLFRYSTLGGYEMAFCGNAGFGRVNIDAVDDRFVKNLRDVYDTVRKTQPRRLVEQKNDEQVTLIETNGLRVLFYRGDFPFPGGKLGLRYNENWVEEAIRFGHRREHLRLCCLVRSEQAITLSWRDAKLYPGLDYVSPPNANSPVRSSQTPVTLVGDVKAIVIGTRKLEDYLLDSKDKSLELHVIDSSGVKQLRRRDGKWGPPSDDDGPF